MSAYVYIKSEPSLWTVGFYDPQGQWQPESDHDHRDSAAQRVHYLNGGGERPYQELHDALDDLKAAILKARP